MTESWGRVTWCRSETPDDAFRRRESPSTGAAALAISLPAAGGCTLLLGTRPPYEPAPEPVVRAMLELAAVRPADLVFDLGSGDGARLSHIRDMGSWPPDAVRVIDSRRVAQDISDPPMTGSTVRARLGTSASRLQLASSDGFLEQPLNLTAGRTGVLDERGERHGSAAGKSRRKRDLSARLLPNR